MDELLINAGYTDLLGEIKSRIRTAQYDALRAVNKELIGLYWNIGELIVRRQQEGNLGTFGCRETRSRCAWGYARHQEIFYRKYVAHEAVL